MYSHWFLYGIYSLLKALTRLCLALYYPATKVTGKERLRLKGPTLLATNHPNTLLDALNGASRVDEQVFFIVNASLFRTSFQSWFFNTFFCIPVERPQDTNGRPINNREAFFRSTVHLAGGGHLYIAPEGSSVLERHLRPLKTGAARIALGAEAEFDFQLGVRLLPIGLNYEQANQFGSGLLINVGAPLMVADFQEAYRKDPREAVRQLTALLEERMSSLIIDTRDEEEDLLLHRLESILQSSDPQDQEQHFVRAKRLIDELRLMEKEEPAALEEFRQKVARYFQVLDRERFSDRIIAEASAPGEGSTWVFLARLLTGFPFFLYGLVNNYLPYFVPRWVAYKLNLYIGYQATLKIMVSLLSFPVFYAFQSYAVARWVNWPWTLVYLVSLVPTGYFAHWYRGEYRNTRDRFRWRKLERRHPEKKTELIGLRREIWNALSGMTESTQLLE